MSAASVRRRAWRRHLVEIPDDNARSQVGLPPATYNEEVPVTPVAAVPNTTIKTVWTLSVDTETVLALRGIASLALLDPREVVGKDRANLEDFLDKTECVLTYRPRVEADFGPPEQLG